MFMTQMQQKLGAVDSIVASTSLRENPSNETTGKGDGSIGEACYDGAGSAMPLCGGQPRLRAAGSEAASVYEGLLLRALERHVAGGRIAFVTSRGTAVVGDGDDTTAPIVVEVGRLDFFRRVVCSGNLGMADSYMAGDFNVKDGQLPEFLTLLLRNRLDRKLKQDKRFLANYLWVRTINWLSSNCVNVRSHYDIGDELFDCFLRDKYQVYSCGYAHSWDDDIDSLQQNKLDRICKKLDLCPGHRLLDIGSGNGGLLVHAALHHGAVGAGVTNSRSHYERSLRNIEKYGLRNRVSVRLGDFMEVEGEYDRVVSVGMLEHVRPSQYRAYFKKISAVLHPKGWGLVHAIGTNAAENKHDPFVQKHVFPGSDTPKLSVVAANVENNDMAIIDVENIVRHYAVTTRRWLESFRTNSPGLDPERYDDAFKRMWEYYLSCGVAAALVGNLAVYQVLFTKDYHAEYRFQRV